MKGKGGARLPSLGPRGRGPLEPQGWDRIVLAGQVLPGHAQVTRGGRSYHVDPKAGKGAHGAKPALMGSPPVELDLEVVVWTDEQLARLNQIVAGIQRDIADDPESAVFPLEAPQAEHLGVPLVMIKHVGLYEETTEPRGRKLTLQLIQWKPPEPVGAQPTKPRKPDRRRPPNHVTDPGANPPADEVLLREVPSVAPPAGQRDRGAR